jgi:hypothetical protein
MADLADIAQAKMELDAEQGKPAPYILDPGKPGDCELCGEWSGRLIDGACAPCRDRFARVRI